MTFDHHTQLIRPARTSGRCVTRSYQGLRNFHTCPAPGLECNSTETATATVCKQSPMESSSLHNQTRWGGWEVGKSVERLWSTMLGVPPIFSISKKINKRLVRPRAQNAGKSAHPSLHRIHFACKMRATFVQNLYPTPPLPAPANIWKWICKNFVIFSRFLCKLFDYTHVWNDADEAMERRNSRSVGHKINFIFSSYGGERE